MASLCCWFWRVALGGRRRGARGLPLRPDGEGEKIKKRKKERKSNPGMAFCEILTQPYERAMTGQAIKNPLLSARGT